MAIKQALREKLVNQAIKEIRVDREHKRSRIKTWNANEDLYYGKKNKMNMPDTRSNVNIAAAKMQGYVHTIMSKIDNPLTFKYKRAELIDMKRADLQNAMVSKDQNKGRWNIKDIVGKKQGVMYGRSINLYFAASPNGIYESHLDPIDAKDFLIDPEAGGLDVEQALNMGWYNTKLTEAQLRDGIKGRNPLYIKSEVLDLLNGAGNEDSKNEEDQAKANRFQSINGKAKPAVGKRGVYKFWTWLTTDTETGIRYYLVMTEQGTCVRAEEMKDVFASDLYPIWTWACFPDLTEFWTPSYCDYVREIFMAQDTSINQMLDNAEQVNKPQKAINVDFVKNLAQVKYKKDSYIEIEGKTSVNDAIQMLSVPPITTPINVYNTLEAIQQVESGITAGAKGVDNADVTLGQYQGNIMQAGDRFGLLNKSYSEGYYRFAILYQEGLQEHLTKKTAVNILGPKGLEIEYITKRDIKPSTDYEILVESSNAEAQSNAKDQENRETFLASYANPQLFPNINQKVLFEMRAKNQGLDTDDINRLLDPTDYGELTILSEADSRFDDIIGGKTVNPYRKSNTMFVQRLVDNLDRYWDELNSKQREDVKRYLDANIKIATANLGKQLMDSLAKQGKLGAGLPPQVTGAAPGAPAADPAAMAAAAAAASGGGAAPAPGVGGLPITTPAPGQA